MQLVDNDSFLEQLNTLFESSKQKGSIWLTHKRFTYDVDDAAMKSANTDKDDREYPCLIRATNGKDISFSTKILSKHLHRFHVAYGALLKSAMSTLRKRDKKREKERAEKIARRKNRMTEPVIITGPKRGNGRKKRQRRIKGAIKQQEAKKKASEREGEKAKAKGNS